MTNALKRSNPPFLNSFNASATILSYVGKTESVIKLLSKLSKSTTQYLENHTPYLNEFVQGPSIPTAIRFGVDTQSNFDHNWQLEEVKKLKGRFLDIHVGRSEVLSVSMLRINRKENRKGCTIVKHQHIGRMNEELGTPDTIRSISVKYFQNSLYSHSILGLKIVDGNGKNLVDIDITPTIGEWKTQDVPDGHRIVGVKESKKSIAFLC